MKQALQIILLIVITTIISFVIYKGMSSTGMVKITNKAVKTPRKRVVKKVPQKTIRQTKKVTAKPIKTDTITFSQVVKTKKIVTPKPQKKRKKAKQNPIHKVIKPVLPINYCEEAKKGRKIFTKKIQAEIAAKKVNVCVRNYTKDYNSMLEITNTAIKWCENASLFYLKALALNKKNEYNASYTICMTAKYHNDFWTPADKKKLMLLIIDNLKAINLQNPSTFNQKRIQKAISDYEKTYTN